jgi:hypothetical protein
LATVETEETTFVWCRYLPLALLVGCSGGYVPDGDGYVYLEDYPSTVETEWSDEAQGVAHDAETSAWYVSSAQGIWRYPGLENLAGGDHTHRVGLPEGCKHFGDVDYQAGRLYVPVEGCNPPVNRLYVLDSDLNFIAWAEIAQESFPWVAVNPVDGLIYTSESTYPTTLNAYAAEFERGDRLDPVNASELVLEHHRIQGGAFSPTGQIYLVDDQGAAGVYGYQLEGADTALTRFIPAADYSPGFPEYEELEGLTVWDLESPSDDFPTGGSIHMVVLDNDDSILGGRDDAYMQHISIDDPSEL